MLSSSKHSGVPEDSQPPTFPSVGLHPHTWPKWGCDISQIAIEKLDNNNFQVWKFRIMNFLMGKGYLEFITGDEIEPPLPENPTQQQIQANKT